MVQPGVNHHRCYELRVRADETSGTQVAGGGGHLVPQVPAQHDRRLQETADAQCGNRPLRADVNLQQAIEKLGAHSGLVSQDDDGPLDIRGKSEDPGPPRTAHPRGVVGVDDDSGSAPTNPAQDQLVIGAEDDHDLVEAGAAGGGHDTLEQRPSQEGRSCFGLPIRSDEPAASTIPAACTGALESDRAGVTESCVATL
jgi:hypothetical protein